MEAQARTHYRLEALGGLAVAGGEAPLSGAATQRRTLGLLAVLAVVGEQGITREKLLGFFWPESDTMRARHALKQALYILRRDLRDAELVLGTVTLRLNPASITSDVQEFEQALSQGTSSAPSSYTGGPSSTVSTSTAHPSSSAGVIASAAAWRTPMPRRSSDLPPRPAPVGITRAPRGGGGGSPPPTRSARGSRSS